MHIVDFPYCCTAHIAVGFAETATAMGDAGEWNYVEPKDVETIERWLKCQIKLVNMQEHAMLTVATNSQQKKVNKALRNLGFKHSVWVGKKQHPRTRIRMWWIDCVKYMKDNEK